jgi:hypothetical protein
VFSDLSYLSTNIDSNLIAKIDINPRKKVPEEIGELLVG